MIGLDDILRWWFFWDVPSVHPAGLCLLVMLTVWLTHWWDRR